jgi:hypothetical protein
MLRNLLGQLIPGAIGIAVLFGGAYVITCYEVLVGRLRGRRMISMVDAAMILAAQRAGKRLRIFYRDAPGRVGHTLFRHYVTDRGDYTLTIEFEGVTQGWCAVPGKHGPTSFYKCSEIPAKCWEAIDSLMSKSPPDDTRS